MCYVRPLLASFSLQYLKTAIFPVLPMTQSRPSPVLEGHISASKNTKKEESTKTYVLYKKHQNQSKAVSEWSHVEGRGIV